MLNRDIRDPRAVGEKLLYEAETVRKTYGADISLSEIWDVHASKLTHPNYSGEMTGFYTAQEYLRELETRDDRYAKSTLDSIRAGAKPSNAEIV